MKRLFISVGLILVIVIPVTFGNISSSEQVSISFAEFLQSTFEFEREQTRLFDEVGNDFADDTVLVLMSQQYSFSFKQQGTNIRFEDYNTEDFPEFAFSDVRDITPGLELAETQIQTMYERATSSNANSRNTAIDEVNDESWNINLDNFRRILILTLQEPSKENVLNAIRKLERRPDIVSAEPNYKAEAPILDETQMFSALSSSTNNWALNRINASGAWDITTGSQDIVVGVMDSGIDEHHPLLAGAIHPDWTMHACYASPTTLIGNPFNDMDGHGTHVAGTISASSASIGVAHNIKIVSLRVFGYNSTNNNSILIDAITHATAKQIPILNHSGQSYPYSITLEQAIRNYGDIVGGLYIAAAGNYSRNTDVTPSYPASYDLPNLISVGNSNQNDQRWSTSNYGKTTVDLFAPGVDIFSTLPGSPFFGYGTGTSMAAPHVAGVAALMLSVNPHLISNPTTVRSIIMKTVDSVSGLKDLCVSGGRLNAFKAVERAANYKVLSSQIIMPSAGTEIILYGNDATFLVTTRQNIGLSIITRTFRFTGNGASTNVRSSNLSGFSGTFVFDKVRIIFKSYSIEIQSTQLNVSYEISNWLTPFNLIIISVTSTSSQNIIV